MVDLPRPEAPMIAVASPAFISNVIPFKVLRDSRGAVMYLKETFWKRMQSRKITSLRAREELLILGFLSITSYMDLAAILAAMSDYTLGRAATSDMNPVMKAIKIEIISSDEYSTSVFELIFPFIMNIPPRKKV